MNASATTELEGAAKLELSQSQELRDIMVYIAANEIIGDKNRWADPKIIYANSNFGKLKKYGDRDLFIQRFNNQLSHCTVVSSLILRDTNITQDTITIKNHKSHSIVSKALRAEILKYKFTSQLAASRRWLFSRLRQGLNNVLDKILSHALTAIATAIVTYMATISFHR